MKKNVLHVLEYFYLGGIERILEQFALNSKDKINNFFFTYETDELKGIGKSIHDLGFPVFTYKKTPGRDFNLVSVLAKTIKEQKIDYVHTHDFGPIEYAIMLKIRLPKLGLIHTQHTVHHFLNKWHYRLFYQFASHFYKEIVAVSKFVEHSLRSRCPFSAIEVLQTIPNGVDTIKFSAQKSASRNSLKLVSISRISYEKNIEYLLSTLILLKSAGIPFEFHHAGTGKNRDSLEHINTSIKKFNLQQQVHFYGFHENPSEILLKGDIYVSASLREGHPVSVLEAMASEKYCLCSDIPPHRETANGAIELFDVNDPEALFKALKKIFINREVVSLQNHKARLVVLEFYSIEKMVNKYASLYT
jgi:glycosyltransferase involved in cell wall biosynthesis